MSVPLKDRPLEPKKIECCVGKLNNFFLFLSGQALKNPLYEVATLVFKRPASEFGSTEITHPWLVE